MLADLLETWTQDPDKRKWTMMYIPILMSIALVCFIAWQLANFYWDWNTPAVEPEPSIPVNAPVPQAQTANYDLNAIKAANLFGEYQAVAVAEPIEEVTDAPDTTLNLNLHGTLLSDITVQSRAIIEVDNKDKVFSIGDEIQNNVSLYSVEATQVIIDNRGRKEALRLPREEENVTNTRRPPPPVARQNAGANRIAQQIRQAALKNPSSITDILRLKKGQTSTGQKGFRVYPGKSRERFKELGLKPGDFVTQVNGLSVGDQNPFQVIQTLGTSTFINLSIERNGQPMNLSFDIGQIQ